MKAEASEHSAVEQLERAESALDRAAAAAAGGD